MKCALSLVTAMRCSLALVTLAACSISPLDYTGKGCPCPSGYQCDLSSNTCTKDDIIIDAPDDTRDAAGDAINPGVSCFANPRTKLIYSSVGFSDFPNGWLPGSGSWVKSGAEVSQKNTATSLAWVAHAVPTTGGVANYRIVATMRVVNGLNESAVGIGLRINVSQATMYFCSYSPTSQKFGLYYSQPGVTVSFATADLVLADPTAQFTMEVNTTGVDHSCCIRGHETVQLSAPQNALPSGNAGLITRDTEGAFASFWAYE